MLGSEVQEDWKSDSWQRKAQAYQEIKCRVNEDLEMRRLQARKSKEQKVPLVQGMKKGKCWTRIEVRRDSSIRIDEN